MGSCCSKPAQVDQTHEKLKTISELYPDTLGVSLINIETYEVVDTIDAAPGFVSRVTLPPTRPAPGKKASSSRERRAGPPSQGPRQVSSTPGIDVVGLAQIYSSGNDIAASLAETGSPLVRLFTTTGAMLIICSVRNPYVVVIYTTTAQGDLGDADLDAKDLQLTKLSQELQNCLQGQGA